MKVGKTYARHVWVFHNCANDDVYLETASPSLHVCQILAQRFHPEKYAECSLPAPTYPNSYGFNQITILVEPLES